MSGGDSIPAFRCSITRIEETEEVRVFGVLFAFWLVRFVHFVSCSSFFLDFSLVISHASCSQMLLLCLLLAGAASVTLPDGVFSGTDSTGATYSFSFRSPLLCTSADSGSGVCQLFGGLSFSAGSFATQRVSVPAPGVIVVTYGEGSMCARTNGPRATTVVLSCDPHTPGVRVLSVAEDPLCQYTINAVSDSACGAQQPDTCSYFVGGVEHDLSSLPTVASGRLPNGDSYLVSLCSAAIDCGGVPSYLCQQTVSGAYSLGTTSQWGATQPYQAVLEYGAGSVCAVTGRPRTAQVTVCCGEVTGLVNVTELQTCEYLLLLVTPLACPPHTGAAPKVPQKPLLPLLPLLRKSKHVK